MLFASFVAGNVKGVPRWTLTQSSLWRMILHQFANKMPICHCPYMPSVVTIPCRNDSTEQDTVCSSLPDRLVCSHRTTYYLWLHTGTYWQMQLQHPWVAAWGAVQKHLTDRDATGDRHTPVDPTNHVLDQGAHWHNLLNDPSIAAMGGQCNNSWTDVPIRYRAALYAVTASLLLTTDCELQNCQLLTVP